MTTQDEPFEDDYHFDDGTTAFGEDEVDAIVYLPPSDSPELRASHIRETMRPQFQPSTTQPAPPDERPVEPWTPPTAENVTQPQRSKSQEIAIESATATGNTVARIAIGVTLVALPLLATWWLISTGMSLYGR